jgi:GT2 family glycosyltransferase
VREIPKVAIIVLNWNGWRDTLECLESLRQLNYTYFLTIVVDNGSTDDSLHRIKAWVKEEEPVESRYIAYSKDAKLVSLILYSRTEAEAGGTDEGETVLSDSWSVNRLVVIDVGENLGFAGGCNVGIRYALKRGAEYFWLLNNDTVADPNALTEMVALAQSDTYIGLVGSVMHYYRDPESVQTYAGGLVNWWLGTSKALTGASGRSLDYISGASMLIKRAVAESVGLLEEERYFFYWEDISYSQRVLAADWEIAVAEGSRLLHKEGGTISAGGQRKSLASDLFAARSMVLFFSSHGGIRWPLAVFLRAGGMVINRLRRRQLDRILLLLRAVVTTCWEVALMKSGRRIGHGCSGISNLEE